MKVLHIGKYFPPFAGGMENFLHALMREQAKQGLDVAAMVHQHDRGVGTVDEQAADWRLRRVRIWGRAIYTPISPSVPWRLKQMLDRFRPDVLHLHLPNPSAFSVLLLPSARRVPWIVHWHSDVVASTLDRRLAMAYRVYRLAEQPLLRRSAAILVTSAPYLEASAALAPWRDKCHVVPLGIDPATTALPSADDLAWAGQQWIGGGLKILAVGRLTYYKGFDVLLRAVAQTPGVQLALVGSGELRESLENLAVELSLGERAKLLGSLPDGRLQALLSTCDCLSLPSIERSEAFGMVLLEAMQHGKPLVVSDIPGSGPGWIARQGPCGLTPELGNVDQLAHALARLRDEPDLRRTLGEAGRQAFDEQFQMSQVASEISRLYRSALTGAGQELPLTDGTGERRES